MGECFRSLSRVLPFRRNFTNEKRRAKFKYMFTIVTLSIFMVYMLAASVVTALQAAQQGGSQNSAMLFSVVITFGCA